ncbi:MAG: hypothetical protein ACYTG7_06660, partial [Planctomycetota bacterium]
HFAEVELDQNGILLEALRTYVDWTGDLTLLEANWEKIRAVAEFPLKEVFRHEESGLLHNQREFWERHSLHGIEEGFELTYQLFVSLGLFSAAELARRLGKEEDADRWMAEAARLKEAMLSNERFALVDHGRLIKRRRLNGDVQEEVIAAPDSGLPAGIPILEEGPHLLNPDTSSVLPIALEFIDPGGALAAATLTEVEKLWNLHWDGGGYSRYHTSSEPDSPGPWPFASLFVARACFEAGDDPKVWRILDWLALLPGAQAGTWFEFYGPRPVPPWPQVGITPWTWAEMVCLFIHHFLGVRPGRDGLILRPRLLRGLERMEATLRLLDARLHLVVRASSGKEARGFYVDGKFLEAEQDFIIIPLPKSDITVEAVL